MGQVRRSDIQVLQGEDFAQTWTYCHTRHTLTLTYSGGATGTFSVTVLGSPSAAIPIGATAAQVQTAICAIGAVGADGCVVTGTLGSTGGTFTLAWAGNAARQVRQRALQGSQPLMATPAFSPQGSIQVALVVKDLTGYTAKSQARAKRGDFTGANPTLWDVTDSSDPDTVGQIVLGGTAGTVELVLPDSVTEALNFGTGDTPTAQYDVILIDPDGKDERFVQGTCTLNKGVIGS